MTSGLNPASQTGLVLFLNQLLTLKYQEISYKNLDFHLFGKKKFIHAINTGPIFCTYQQKAVTRYSLYQARVTHCYLPGARGYLSVGLCSTPDLTPGYSPSQEANPHFSTQSTLILHRPLQGLGLPLPSMREYSGKPSRNAQLIENLWKLTRKGSEFGLQN